MEADLLLCDHAEAVNGKLYIMGAAWNLLQAPGQAISIALAIVVKVGWDEADQGHDLVAVFGQRPRRPAPPGPQLQDAAWPAQAQVRAQPGQQGAGCRVAWQVRNPVGRQVGRAPCPLDESPAVGLAVHGFEEFGRQRAEDAVPHRSRCPARPAVDLPPG